MFTDFEMEHGWDFVYIYEGSDDSGVPVQALTGCEVPTPHYRSTGYELYIKIDSDGIIPWTGFLYVWGEYVCQCCNVCGSMLTLPLI